MVRPYDKFNQSIYPMSEIAEYTETINDRYKIFRTMTNIVNNCPDDANIMNEIIYP